MAISPDDPTQTTNDRLRKGAITVKEVRELLAKYPPNARVVVSRNMVLIKCNGNFYALGQYPSPEDGQPG
jgi:hypothetical protein